jgi:threonine/homoserine/homoserine lactone efflux protein
MTSYLVLGSTFAFAAAVQPGPLQAYLVSQTLTFGWQRTIVAGFSPLVSDGPIIALCLLILSQVPPVFVHALQIVGGMYLLYLAADAFKTYRSYDAERVLQVQSSRQTLFRAAFVNLLNPNPYLAWSLVMGPLLLKAWREAPLHGIVLLASFYITLVVTLFATILLFSATKRLGAKINRALIGGSVLALGGFGLYELWSGVNVLL